MNTAVIETAEQEAAYAESFQHLRGMLTTPHAIRVLDQLERGYTLERRYAQLLLAVARAQQTRRMPTDDPSRNGERILTEDDGA